MTNVRRPIQLQLKSPTGAPLIAQAAPPGAPTIRSPVAKTTIGELVPSKILPHLFVGSLEQTNRDTLDRFNITYILSLGLLPLISNGNNPLPSQNSSKDFKIKIRSLGSNDSSPLTSTSLTTSEQRDENKAVRVVRTIYCKCINIADNSEQNLSKFFDETHQFIDEARKRKSNILIHCLKGVSRSPTIAIAYLMSRNSLCLEEAYQLVKQCRPQIDPNLSFMGQLMMYDKNLNQNNQSGTNCARQNINNSINLIHHHHHYAHQSGKIPTPT